MIFLNTPDAPREVKDIIMKLQERGIPAFLSIPRGARALKSALDYYRLRNDTANWDAAAEK
jgi:hypothetical protein